MVAVIAHRGASADRPENTVEAFVEAVAQGADAIELDVRRSADSSLVVSHDDTYADGRTVCETTFADRPTGVPDLTGALDACGDLVVNVEIKNMPVDHGYEADAAIADDVAALLLARGTPDRFLVSSFDLATIDRVRTVAPVLETAFLFTTVPPLKAIDIAASRGHGAVHPHDYVVDATFVAYARDFGLAVNVWTVDDPVRIRQLADLGVDGIVTNTPRLAREALGVG